MVFFTIDETKHARIDEIERLASWAARYTKVLRFMAPFTQQLYQQINGIKNRKCYIVLDVDTIFVIQLWRVALILLQLDNNSFSRPLESFRILAPRRKLDYDGSLQGVGFLLFELTNDEPILKLYCSYMFQMSLPDPSFQNSSEFLALTLGLTALAWLGIRDQQVSLVGDSVSSLTWASTGKFWSSRAQRASVCFVEVGRLSRNEISEKTLIPSEDNVDCDRLSRGLHLTYTHDSTTRLVIEDVEPLYNIATYCDPLRGPLMINDGVGRIHPDWTELITNIELIHSV